MVVDWTKIEALAMDIDGTLSTRGRFAAEVVAVLHALKRAGFTLILVTGRPSGWVQGLVSYLPVDAAIAENGGVVFRGAEAAPLLRKSNGDDYEDAIDVGSRRALLAEVFNRVVQKYPGLKVTEDNVYRLSDYTFHVAGLDSAQLFEIRAFVESLDFAFTWSTIHAHIMPHGQEKGSALCWLLQQMHLPASPASSTLTVGDSPNDVTLFDEGRFPCSAGVANIEKYRGVMSAFPKFISTRSEGDGFVELACKLLDAKGALL
ncbi:MAG: HAD family phosphatase [Betaproteobacteria bacterium]|nr:HAD family phosphatase [Betaproteobacteria bacterium]